MGFSADHPASLPDVTKLMPKVRQWLLERTDDKAGFYTAQEDQFPLPPNQARYQIRPMPAPSRRRSAWPFCPFASRETGLQEPERTVPGSMNPGACHRCCSKWGLQNCPSSRQLWTRANADGGPPLAVFQDRSLNVAQQPDIQKPLVPLSLHSGLLGISQGLGSPLDKEGGDIEETAKGWAKSKCTAVKRARSRSITKEETSVSQKSPKQRQPPMHE